MDILNFRTLVAVGILACSAAARAQQIKEFSVPTKESGDGDITAGPDGALWFTEGFGDKIGRVTTDGLHFAEHQLTTVGSGVLNIRPGPDGALWFTETFAGKIGRITTSGQLKEYVLPSQDMEPISLATGPDGALWFTLAASGKIGRITTAGVFSFFTIPESMAVPVGITSGPDGALWFSTSPNFFYFLSLAFPGSMFTSSGGAPGAIWRLTTAGTFQKFTSPTLLSDVDFIIPGPDGALWFTQNEIQKVGGTFTLTASSLGRITTDGDIETFPGPTQTGGALGMVLGADDAFYFTEPAYTANKIGRMTVDGDFSEYPIPSAEAVPAGITLGPDGDIWFVESSTTVNKIGRLSLGCGITVSRACASPIGPGTELRVTGRKKLID